MAPPEHFQLQHSASAPVLQGGSPSSSPSSSPENTILVLGPSDLQQAPRRRRTAKKESSGPGLLFRAFSTSALPDAQGTGLRFEELPDFLKDNAYLKQYHRGQQYTVLQALKTAWALHTDTTNIYSHLAAFLLLLAMAVTWAMQPPSSAPLWPQLVFYACGMYTMGISTVAHLLHVVSKRMSRLMWSLDYAGIVIIQVGYFVPYVCYSFLCNSAVVPATYLGVTGLLASAVICMTLCERFQVPEYRAMRVSLLATMALWGQLPLWHAAYLNYGAAAEAREATWTVVASLLIVGLGGFVYAVRVPERWLPGAFDLFGNSHNIMHFLVAGGILLYHNVGSNLYQWRSSAAGACPATALPVF